MNRLSFDSPLGPLTLFANDMAMTRLDWGRRAAKGDDRLLAKAVQQLNGYFTGTRRGFDLPLAPEVSDFQRAVCAAMSAIPFGEVRTYGDIAADLGVTPQAVGQACGANPIPIIIPCHRVLGAGGKLVGFSGAGGVETKVWLLRHEKAAGLLI